ncbi:PREDICTED: uncharacterized protein LOC104811030 [Tarenaya hassleriana]|uniref:uncharacterized protein LOC104811030 n=1 Tax=Tarenaya hassleriana TaxID=28532 RepID=UPI00053C7181|nr:PREDICTED: uncharacterized protein LOC104811030 [Tarenaya hassleriana]
MLLRSASTPVLNSLVHVSNPRESPINGEFVHQIPRTSSVVLSASSCCCYSPMSVQSSGDATRRMSRAMSETDLRDLSAKATPASKFLHGAPVEEIREEGIGFGLARTSSLDCGFGLGVALEEGREVSVGNCAGGFGGNIYFGGRGGSDGGDGHGGFGSWEPKGNDVIEAHYQKMIAANPGNGLLLSNYAKFLKEVRGDLLKAEEYCGRAILANPNNGDVLSMYGELIWQSHGDSSRAETYFDQAVKAAPDDCYVLASYARFLWDAEDEDEEEQEEGHECQTPNLNVFNGQSPISSPA